LRENAGFGPGVDELVSVLELLTEVVCWSTDDDVGGGGGGSMAGELAGTEFETGSGNEGIGSSEEDVSMVMCLVVG